MKLRSYHTDSVETAIRMAGIELGDGAVFLGSKKTADAGPYEVTFALLEKPGGSAGDVMLATPRTTEPSEEGVVLPNLDAGHWRRFVPADPETEAKDAEGEGPVWASAGDAPTPPIRLDQRPSASPQAVLDEPPPQELGDGRTPSWRLRRDKEQRLSRSVEELSRSFEQLREWLQGQPARDATAFFPDSNVLENPVSAALYAELTRQGVQPKAALDLLSDLTADAETPDLDDARERTEERLGRLCSFDASLGTESDGPRIVALVGPPGVGKTSTLAKLAIRYGLGRGTSLELVAADPVRVGVTEPLEAYARLFGVPLTHLTEPEALAAVLAEIAERTAAGDRSLVFIDTPGYGRSEWGHAERLAECLTAVPGSDVHLVLSLNTKPNDLRRAIESYRMFEPAKLLFTKLDETETFGAALNEALRTEWPLSFFANGTRVPEDLAPASATLLNRLLLRRSSIAVQ